MNKSLYVVPEDTRYKAYYEPIRTIGSRYVTLISGDRFFVGDYPLKSACNTQGYNPNLIAYESEEQYISLQNNRKTINIARAYIMDFINQCEDLAVLQYIGSIIPRYDKRKEG